MKAAELVQSRMPQWRQLDLLCDRLEERGRKKIDARRRTEFAALYRAACADLALADAYQLPPATVRYLHHLVGRAHNQLYRSQTFRYEGWRRELFELLPRRMFHDNSIRLAAALFWGSFLAAAFLASRWTPIPQFANVVIGEEYMGMLEMMYSNAPGTGGGATGFESAAFGFYVMHNTGIGLRCFAMGLLLGVGGLFATFFNAVFLGACFGYMSTTPQSENFFTFVTAHGPFELTAIVLSAAAGMRLGFSLVDTRGLSRLDSLNLARRQAMPVIVIAIVLFFLAALIEGFISPSGAPYELKAMVAMLSMLALLGYFVVLGYSRQPEESEDEQFEAADLD